jgi:PAS domain S-box-containing protein
MPQDRDRLFLESIVRSVPAMIFVKDAEGLRFELFNPAGEALVGVSEKDLLGKSDRDFFPADQAASFNEIDRQVLAGKKLVDVGQEPLDTPTGKRWLHTRKVPILGPDGEPKYLLGIAIDVTEQKLAQDALDERNRQLTAKEEELKRTLSQLLALEGLVAAAADAAEACRKIVAALDAGDTKSARALAAAVVDAVEVAHRAT